MAHFETFFLYSACIKAPLPPDIHVSLSIHNPTQNPLPSLEAQDLQQECYGSPFKDLLYLHGPDLVQSLCIWQ